MMWRMLAAAVLGASVLAGVAGGASLLAAGGQEAVRQVAQVQEPPDEWVSVDELPPEDRLPGAPLLVGAYGFVLAVLFTYVTMVARRLTGLQRDIARLESQIGSDGKG